MPLESPLCGGAELELHHAILYHYTPHLGLLHDEFQNSSCNSLSEDRANTHFATDGGSFFLSKKYTDNNKLNNRVFHFLPFIYITKIGHLTWLK